MEHSLHGGFSEDTEQVLPVISVPEVQYASAVGVSVWGVQGRTGLCIPPGSAWGSARGERGCLEMTVYGWAFLAVEVEELYLLGRPGQREHVVDLAGSACHDQSLSGAAGVDACVGDDMRGGGVYKGELAYVEHDQAREGGGFFEYPFEFWAA